MYQNSYNLACAIFASGAFILTRSKLTFKITPNNYIPVNGQLVIELPLVWDDDVDDLTTLTSSPSCASLSGISGSISCSYVIA